MKNTFSRSLIENMTKRYFNQTVIDRKHRKNQYHWLNFGRHCMSDDIKIVLANLSPNDFNNFLMLALMVKQLFDKKRKSPVEFLKQLLIASMKNTKNDNKNNRNNNTNNNNNNTSVKEDDSPLPEKSTIKKLMALTNYR